MITSKQQKKEKTAGKAVKIVEEKRNHDMMNSDNQTRKLVARSLFNGKIQKKQKIR